MINQQLHRQCDSEKLNELLIGSLSTEEEAAIESHLSQCSSCAEKIQLAAVPGTSWDEAQSMLALDEFDGGPSVASHSSLFPFDMPDREDTLTADLLTREIQGWLDPTDDPQMLGRFAGYEIVGIIGHGGMGIVLKGFEASLNRYVAIKVLAPRLASNGSARQRFSREAQAAAAVLHENVVAIHRVDQFHGLPFLVMPYVAGISLQKRIDDEGPLRTTAVLRIGSQIAAGLAAAHHQGLVHRDIKPANILLDKGVERVTITDFGLARAMDDATVTRTGIIAGTPQYMSPEQAQAKPLDARSDLFSLGSVLYAICTGRPPFRAETSYAVMRRIKDEDPRPIRDINPDIPEWLCHIINSLMSKRADDRFESASEVAELFEECLAHVQQPTVVPLPPKIEHVAELAKSLGVRGLSKALATSATKRSVKWLIATAFFAFVLIFASVLISIELNKGTLTIECEADGVPIKITQGDKVVEKLTVNRTGASVRIAAGKYVVEIDDKADGISIKDGIVELQRRGQRIVSVVLKEAPRVADSRNRDQNLPQKPANRRSYMLQFSGRHGTHLVIPKLRYDGSHPITLEATAMSLYRGSILADFNGSGLGLDVADGYCSFHVNDGRQADNGYVRVKSGISVGRNKLVHVAGVLDGSELSLFVDGKFQGSETIGTFNKSKFPLMIGADPGGQGEPTQFLIGFIDEVRVSKTARYDKNFTPPTKFASDEHTLALYRFDEGEGDVAHDASNNALHARIHDAKWVAAKAIPGTVDSGALDGDVRLDGTWSVVKSGPFGRPATDSWEYYRWSFDRRKHTLTMRCKRKDGATTNSEFRFTLITTTNPKKLVLNKDQAEIQATYQFDGDLLRVTIYGWREGGEVFVLRQLRESTDPTASKAERDEDSALWNEFGVTPAPVAPLTARVLEWIGLHLRPIAKKGFRGKNVFAKYSGGLALTFVRTHGPAEKAGIHDADIVVTLRGLRVDSLKELDSAIQDAVRNDADSLEFQVLRSGETVDVNVPIALGELAATDVPGDVEPIAIQRLREFGAKITKKDGVITEILIGHSPITDADMAGFESIDSLESLTVFGCMNVTDATFARLKTLPHLTVLNIAPSNITDVGVSNLKGLKDLSFLSFNGTKVTDAGLRHLIDNSKIRVLYLNETTITDKGLVFLEQMKDMHSLDLGATAVTDAGLAHLGHMSKLHQLHLSRSAVTDAGMKHVSRLSNIVSLRLNDTSISDVGLVHLAKLPKLQDLQVLNTKVTRKGIDALKRALPGVIVRQNVSAAPVVDFSKYGQAAVLMRWSASLDSKGEHVEVELDDEGRVTSVHMGGGDITDEGLSHLRDLKDVENLTLSYTYGCTAEGLRHVQQMAKVKFLRLWGNYNFSDGVGYLSGMTNVETLFLHKLRVTDENMKFVKGMKGCRYFQMTLNPTVTDVGIAHLAGLTELESIYLTCPQLTDKCLKYFHDMHKLDSLSIASPHVTNAALRRLSKTLPNLKTVNNEPVEKLFENSSEEKPADGEAKADRKQGIDDGYKDTTDKSPQPDGNITSNPRPQRILGFVPRLEEVKRDEQAKVPASHWPNALEEIRKGVAKKFPKMELKQDYRGEHGLQHLIYRQGSDAILLTLTHCKTPREAGEALRLTDQQFNVRTTADIRVKGLGDEAYVHGTPERTGTFLMCYSNIYVLINSNTRYLQTTAARVIVTALETIAQKQASNVETAGEKPSRATDDSTRIQGSWKLLFEEKNGNKEKVSDDVVFTFDKNRVLLGGSGNPLNPRLAGTRTFSLDDKSKPKELVMTYKEPIWVKPVPDLAVPVLPKAPELFGKGLLKSPYDLDAWLSGWMAPRADFAYSLEGDTLILCCHSKFVERKGQLFKAAGSLATKKDDHRIQWVLEREVTLEV